MPSAVSRDGKRGIRRPYYIKYFKKGKKVVTFQPATAISKFKIEYKDQAFAFNSTQFSKHF